MFFPACRKPQQIHSARNMALQPPNSTRTYRSKCSITRSSVTFSGKFPTQRYLVSRTMMLKLSYFRTYLLVWHSIPVQSHSRWLHDCSTHINSASLVTSCAEAARTGRLLRSSTFRFHNGRSQVMRLNLLFSPWQGKNDNLRHCTLLDKSWRLIYESECHLEYFSPPKYEFLAQVNAILAFKAFSVWTQLVGPWLWICPDKLAMRNTPQQKNYVLCIVLLMGLRTSRNKRI